MIPRVFPFPALRLDAIDFTPERALYGATVRRFPESGIVSVRHVILGDNLISHLLSDGKAKFACVVCAPSTMYRTLEVSSTPPDSKNEDGKPALEVAQEVGLEDSHVAAPPMFRPIVIAAEEIRQVVDADATGLNSIYSGREVHFPQGSIIASAGWMQLGGGGEEMLVLHDDKSLKEGMIHVVGDTSHGYRFIVKAASGLYREIRRSGKSRKDHRDSVLTHALSAGLQLLANEYGRDAEEDESNSWKQYPNLRLLSDWLREKGQPTWCDDGFSADKAATALKPHFIPVESDDA